MPEKPRVTLARLGAPHGVRGEVRAAFFGEDPQSLIALSPLEGGGRTMTVRSARPAKNVLVLTIEGVDDREAAEALKGIELSVPRERLPDDLDEGEFYHADLIGLEAVTASGETLGTVTAVQDHGAGDILDITPPGGASLLIPFTRKAVPEIDVATRRVTVDPVAAGLEGAVIARGDDAEE